MHYRRVKVGKGKEQVQALSGSTWLNVGKPVTMGTNSNLRLAANLPCPTDCGETEDYRKQPANVSMGYPIHQKALMQTVYSADGLGTKEEYLNEQSKSSDKKTNWLLIAAVAVIGYLVYKYA